MANVKLGNNTLTGVSTVRLQSADVAGEYVSFNDLVAQEKTAAVTTNGTTEVTPDSGKRCQRSRSQRLCRRRLMPLTGWIHY